MHNQLKFVMSYPWKGGYACDAIFRLRKQFNRSDATGSKSLSRFEK